MIDFQIQFPLKNKVAIKAAAKKLQDAIKSRESEIKVLRSMLEQVQTQCTHPGQQTGYNERDGSWANPCSICGESH